MYSILVIEDDDFMRDLEEKALVRAGFRVVAVPDASSVRNILSTQTFDLIITDLSLPDEDGYSITRYVREHYKMGIIIVSSRNETTDRVVGIEIGADDYVTKPFQPNELIARVRSVLRRYNRREEAKPGGKIFTFAGWRLNANLHEVHDPDGGPVKLTSGEYQLLYAFVTHPNRVLSRDQLLEHMSKRAFRCTTAGSTGAWRACARS